MLDLRLPDMTGFEVLERISQSTELVRLAGRRVHGPRAVAEEDAQLQRAGAQRRREGRGVAGAAARRDGAVPPPSGHGPAGRDVSGCSSGSTARTTTCVGKSVLVVDDDVRNIFALSSVLERRGMKVLSASTGNEAIDLLEATSDVAIVLMDIMMPEMDGYETMRVIRRNPSFRRLPIVALTAKAMKGDREKCFEAGASDYLAKPVNTDQLLSALRMWLHR